jgi:hypothetical protein
MQDYRDFPPLKNFMRVLKVCPKSALLYLQIWENKDDFLSHIIRKREIRKQYLISPTMFRNLLAPLMLLNLIHFEENDDKYEIDVFGPLVNEA